MKLDIVNVHWRAFFVIYFLAYYKTDKEGVEKLLVDGHANCEGKELSYRAKNNFNPQTGYC